MISIVHWKVIAFVAVSAGLVWLSRASLRKPRYHGFYRLFAFEAILALILLNFDCWFCRPLSTHQIVSWLLLAVSAAGATHGYLLLLKAGEPDSRRDDPSLIGIERTTELVQIGAYRYIRHPIYSSGLLGAWGVFFKQPSLMGACLAIITTFFFTATAKTEEAENVAYFGAAYQDYMKRTKMFIPYLF